MFTIDLPPPIWIPPKPAIIRAADSHLLDSGYHASPGLGLLSFLPGMAAAFGAEPAVFTYVTGYNSGYTGGDDTFWTFPSANIGTASADRIVIVGLGAVTAFASARTFTGVTIGGVAATVYATTNYREPTAIAALAVATGTSANIVVTCSGNIDEFQIFIGTLTKYMRATPTTNQNTNNSGSVTSTIDSVGGGLALAMTNNGNTSWSGLSQLAINANYSLGGSNPSSDRAGMSVTATGTRSFSSITLAAWR